MRKMISKLLAVASVLAILSMTGCAGLNPARLATTGISTAAGGATGAAIGTAVGGPPIGTAIGGGIGAVSGYVVGEAIGSYNEGQKEKAKEEGYELGRADSAKDHYWMLQRMQASNSSEEFGEFTTIDIPMQGGETPDGINLVPHMVQMPVVQ